MKNRQSSNTQGRKLTSSAISSNNNNEGRFWNKKQFRKLSDVTLKAKICTRTTESTD